MSALAKEPVFDRDGRCIASKKGLNDPGKKAYPSKMEALLQNQDRPIMARAYFCQSCRMWHLTRKRQR